MSEDFLQHIEFIEKDVPFNVLLGLKVAEIDTGSVCLLLPYRDEFIGDKRRPALHGGLISTLLDTAGGAASWTYCNPEDKIATVDMRVDYLLPGPPEDLHARAEVRRLGNRVAVTHMSIHPVADAEYIVAEGRGVYNIRRVNLDE